ncbi:hypothetical protein BJ970_006100 [Saccharopolyspora phatthalungensis]|uniref:Uncharacterized protein n=1 Tax=Saccharopolyspora phatthalungensis TaxID=664693 RepID=A0A840QER1_9PSEU|nr:hypothetical protein [Saccharopolyspora phatthalungensis]
MPASEARVPRVLAPLALARARAPGRAPGRAPVEARPPEA